MRDESKNGVTFIHLKTHSAYSLAEGALHIKQMAGLAKEMGSPALAITDTGNLFGALEFSDALSEKGIQPIIGCTLKIACADQSAQDAAHRQKTGLRKLPSLALLAKDEAGYRNLMLLSSRAYLDTPDTAEPHVSMDYLATHADGLICLTGGPDGPVNEALVQGQPQVARGRVEELTRIFGDRLYVELQRHGTENEQLAEPGLIDLAYELNLPLVATNEPYFAKLDDYAAHDALICIAEGEVVAAEDRRRLTPEHYFKSPQQMAALFADIPEAIASTVEIARRCAYRVRSQKPILPRYSEGDEAEELRCQAEDGLAARLKERGLAEGYSEEDYCQRLEFELDVIIKMKYPGSFLIVSVFIK
jgi:DNA polymerase III subunit alpha